MKSNRSKSAILKKYERAYETCVKKAMNTKPKSKKKLLKCINKIIIKSKSRKSKKKSKSRKRKSSSKRKSRKRKSRSIKSRSRKYSRKNKRGRRSPGNCSGRSKRSCVSNANCEFVYNNCRQRIRGKGNTMYGPALPMDGKTKSKKSKKSKKTKSKNSRKKSSNKSSKKSLNSYQKFVKEHSSKMKDLTMSERMKKIGKMWKEQK